MRISDWSSDVCSSDLRANWAGSRAAFRFPRSGRIVLVRRCEERSDEAIHRSHGARDDRARARCGWRRRYYSVLKNSIIPLSEDGFCKTKHEFLNEIKERLPGVCGPGSGICPDGARAVWRREGSPHVVIARRTATTQIQASAGSPAPQNGGAQCRERGWQYVWISVAALTLIKKQNTNTKTTK